MILMLFHLFCMFDDYWRMNHRSLNSAGKSTVKIQYLQSSEYKTKNLEVPILPNAGGSQKGRTRWAPGGPGAAPIAAEPAPCEAALAHLWQRPFAYFIPPKT